MRSSILVVLVVASCGGSSATTFNGTSDQACSDSAIASCMMRDACHVNQVTIAYRDMSTCIARAKANCVASLAAMDTGRTPANEEACAKAYVSASCTDFLQNTIAACHAPVGTRLLGASCTFPAQCQSAFCSFVPGAACGTCATPTAIGQSCATTQCSSGQVCVTATSTCQAYGDTGASCSHSSECQVGFECVGFSSTVIGTCMRAAESAGAACDRKAGPTCDYLKGLYCSFLPGMTAGTCVSEVDAPATQFCGPTAGSGSTPSSNTICVGASECVTPSTTNTGTCVADAADGAACDSVNGPFCMSPARCVAAAVGVTTGTCQLPDPTKC